MFHFLCQISFVDDFGSLLGPVWEHFCDCLRTLWTRSDMMLYLFAEASFFEDFGSLCGVLVGTYL